MVVKVKNTCHFCGKKYFGYGKLFCSYQCSANAKSKLGRIEKKCETCGKIFSIRKSDGARRPAKFCSHKCVRKGGTQDFRKLYANKKWKNDVKKRDNYTCQNCGSKKNLHAHHVISFAFLYKETKLLNMKHCLYDIDNGETLCRNCHIKTYNYGNTGAEDKLYNRMYVYWEKNKPTKEFDIYYKRKMEEIITLIKDKLN